MSQNQIEMIPCPVCNKNFIDEGHEFVCQECAPEVDADLLVYDVHKAVQAVDSHLDMTQLKRREQVLVRAYHHLGAIVEALSKMQGDHNE